MADLRAAKIEQLETEIKKLKSKLSLLYSQARGASPYEIREIEMDYEHYESQLIDTQTQLIAMKTRETPGKLSEYTFTPDDSGPHDDIPF